MSLPIAKLDQLAGYALATITASETTNWLWLDIAITGGCSVLALILGAPPPALHPRTIAPKQNL